MKKIWQACKAYPIAVVFFVFLMGFSVLDALWPKRAHSELENRDLAQKPQFSIASVVSRQNPWICLLYTSFFHGRPTVLFEHGKLYEKNLAAARMDINEFLTQCRTAGYFDLAQLESAVLETNGQVSFLPLSQQRPVTPQDLGLAVQPEKPCVCVVMDGHVLADNLKATGNDGVWLRRELAAQKAGRLEDVFLATVNAQNQLTRCV